MKKSIRKYVLVSMIVAISPFLLGTTESMMGLLTQRQLSKIGVSPDARLEPVFFYYGINDTHQYAFVIVRASCGSVNYYIFQSDVISEAVKYQFVSLEEVLDFFSAHFKGIANDLLYGLDRPDITKGPNWPDGVQEKTLMPLAYAGYASAIEDAKAKKAKGSLPANWPEQSEREPAKRVRL